MSRVVWLFTGIFAATLFQPAGAAGADKSRRHLRSDQSEVKALIESATDQSETVSELVGRLAASDVVAYIELMRLPTSLAGRLSFVGAAGGVRYVRIQIDMMLAQADRIAILGHELCHAVEIAAAPVANDADVHRLYERIGFQVDQVNRRYESPAAVETTTRVRRELLGRHRLVATN